MLLFYLQNPWCGIWLRGTLSIKKIVIVYWFLWEKQYQLKDWFVFPPVDSFTTRNIWISFLLIHCQFSVKMYLLKTKQWEGETPHSYRSGCALTLSWLGISNEQITTHVGWKSDSMLHHYTKANEMCSLSSSAQVMSKCTVLSDTSWSQKINQYKDVHHFLKVVP